MSVTNDQAQSYRRSFCVDCGKNSDEIGRGDNGIGNDDGAAESSRPNGHDSVDHSIRAMATWTDADVSRPNSTWCGEVGDSIGI